MAPLTWFPNGIKASSFIGPNWIDIRAWGAVGDGSDETAIIEAVEASTVQWVDLAGLTITTTLDPDTLAKSYVNGTVFGEDADGNVHAIPNRSVIYDSEIRNFSTQTPILDLNGGVILTVGTSIQHEGTGDETSYPELAATMLGATCINMAWSGSSVCYDKDGDDSVIGTVKRLSMTQDDVDAYYSPGNAYDDAFDAVTKASKMTLDYRVKAQMATYQPWLFLFEHNRNDMDRDAGELVQPSVAISSVTLGATTVLTLANTSLGLAVGDAVRIRVTGIAKLDYFAARVQAVSGAQITLNLDSAAFAGSFSSGTCYKVDRNKFREACMFVFSYVNWVAAYYEITVPAIVMTSAPSEYDSDSYDYRIRSNAQIGRGVALAWGCSYFDLNASLGIDEVNHRTFLGDGIHPTDQVARQAIANHLAAYLSGGKMPALRREQVLLRAQTEDWADGYPAVYDRWQQGFVDRDWLVDATSSVHSDNFSSGLGGYTLTGTSPTTGTSPWDGGNTALSCTHNGVSGTSYIQKTGMTLDAYVKVSFKIYLASVSGLTGPDTTATIPVMHLRTASVHHAVQLVAKENSASLRGYVIPAGASPATIIPQSYPLTDATVHSVTYEVIKASGSRDGSCILTVDGNRTSTPVTFDDSSKSTPDRVFLGIISNTGDEAIEIWFDDLSIEKAAVLTLPTGTFTTADAKTVTVAKGRITKIV